MNNNKAFTLVELILVIVILGILSATVVPQFFDVQDEAKETVVNHAVGVIKNGITMYAAERIATTGLETYPLILDAVPDNTPCSAAHPCFTEILSQPVTDETWHKINGNNYDWEYGAPIRHFHYDAGTGVFYEN